MEKQTLQCPNYEHNVLAHMYDLYQRGQLCDLALQTADRVFSVHKVILTASSRYFKSLFDSGNMQGPSCVLPKLESGSALILIEFMYTGYITLSADNVWLILSAASTLDIPQVTELCQQYLKSNEDNMDDNDPKLELYDPDRMMVLESVKLEHDDSQSLVIVENSSGTQIPTCNDTDYTVHSDEDHDDGTDKVPEMFIEESAPSIGLKLKINLKQRKSKNGGEKLLQQKSSETSNILMQQRKNIYKKKIDQIVQNEQKTFKSETLQTVPHKFSITAVNVENSRKSHKKLNLIGDIDLKPDLPVLKRGRGRPKKSSAIKVPDKSVTTSIVSKGKRRSRSINDSNKTIAAEVMKGQVINLKSDGKPFVCKCCGAEFSFRSCLKYHQILLHRNSITYSRRFNLLKTLLFIRSRTFIRKPQGSNNKFKCTLKRCGKTFNKFYKFRYHVNLKHFKSHCRLCKWNVCYPARHFVIKHLDKWDGRRKLYKCGLCRRVFIFKGNLKSHLLETHMHSKPEVKSKVKTHSTFALKCEQMDCNFVARGRRDMLSHMTTSHTEVKLQCQQCNFSTPLKKDLEKHSQIHSPDTDKRCEVCKKTFNKPAQLRMHKYAVHKIEMPGLNIFRCDVMDCDYSCIHQNMLRKHQLIHNDDRRYTCGECGKQLKTPITLEKHINKVHKGIKPYMCEICGVSYGEESELKIHINRHGDVKTFYCDKCDYSTYDKGNYKSHLFNRHREKLTENMKTFSCNICDYVTDVKYRYNDHMRVHLNMRDIACPECDKCFMTRKALRGHIIKVHKPKNLHCDFCGYATADISKLKEHSRIMHTHRNFKPYKCAYCSFTCATSGNCRKHVMQKHRGLEVKVIKLVDKMPDPGSGKQDGMQSSDQKCQEDPVDEGSMPVEGVLLQGILQYADRHTDKLQGMLQNTYPSNNQQSQNRPQNQYYNKLPNECGVNNRGEQGIDMTYNPSQYNTSHNVQGNGQQAQFSPTKNQDNKFTPFQNQSSNNSSMKQQHPDLSKKTYFPNELNRPSNDIAEELLKRHYENEQHHQSALERYQALLLSGQVASQHNH